MKEVVKTLGFKSEKALKYMKIESDRVVHSGKNVHRTNTRAAFSIHEAGD